MHVVVVDAQNLMCFMRDNLKGIQYIDELVIYTVTMHWYIM